MRKDPTPAEAKLWESLRGQRLQGMNFRRQHAVGPYIADFFAPEAGIIVEVDGPVHDTQQDRDAARQSYLEAGGFRVLRFSNADVLTQLDRVLTTIAAAANSRDR